MRLRDAVAILKAENIVPPTDETAEITGVFAADLMSDVLAFAGPGALLITGLITDQTVRTAAITQVVAVVVIEGKVPGSEMIEAAREQGVPLYRSYLSKYEACGLLWEAGLRSYKRGARQG